MNVSLQKRAKRFIHSPVTLPCRLPAECLRDDDDAKVPAAAGAGMSRVRSAIVGDLQMLRSERTLEAGADALDAIRGHRTPELSATQAAGVLFIAIHTPCAMEKASVSPMPPKSLNLTQNSSLKL